jgi:hypothetical protein
MPFGNEDPIDKRHKEQLQQLRARNKELEAGLSLLIVAFDKSTSLSQRAKEQALSDARRVLYQLDEAPNVF